MSIASEVTRLQNAKANLKTAIEAKGVDVADTDTIDTFASKVDEIQIGGEDSWYDTFWDNYQQNGERANYNGAFAGACWTTETFKPKYDILPKGDVHQSTMADMMFFKSTMEIDLVEHLEKLGVTLDLRGARNLSQTFSYSAFTRLGVIDISESFGAAWYRGLFDDMPNLVRIDKIKCAEKTLQVLIEACFRNTPKLEYIRFEGDTFRRSMSFKTSPLNLDTAKHIIGLLTNYAGTDEEFTNTFTFSPTTWGYLDAEGDTASPNGNSWREYINDLGWNAS